MIAGTLEIQMLANIARLQSDMNQAKGMVSTTMQGIESAVARAKVALGSLGIGLGLQQVIALTDEYTKFTAQLKLATGSTSDYGKALADVRGIARTAQTELGSVGVLYARIANGTRELGLSQQRVSAITETVSLALKASGATAAESSSAMLQLSQAFSSGVLRGQEFNAVNEAAPRLMRALADGIGVPVGQLRAMAEAGKLTSAVMAVALPKALEDLRKEAAQVQTISGAFTVLKNNMMEFVGTQSQANGTVSVLTGAIGFLADNLRVLAAVLTGLTVLKAAQWFAALTTAAYAKATAIVTATAAAQAERTATIASTAADVARLESTLAFIAADRARAVSQLQSAQATMAATAAMGAQSAAIAANVAATAASSAAMTELATLGRLQAATTTQLTAAQAGLTAAQASGGVVATGLARVVGLLGGPIGAITTLLSLGAAAWVMWGGSAKSGSDKASAAVSETHMEVIARLDQQIKKLKERADLAKAGLPEVAKSSMPEVERLGAALAELGKAQRAEGDYAAMSAHVRAIAIIELKGRYEELRDRILSVASATAEVNAVDASTKIELWLAKNKEFATTAQKLAAELKQAKTELGDAFNTDIAARITEAVTKTKETAQAIAVAQAAITLDLQRDLLSKERQLNEDNYRAGLLDLGAYYANRESIAKRSLDAETAGIAKQIEAQRAIMNRDVATPDDVKGARIKIMELTAQQRKLELDAGMEFTAIWRGKEQAVREFYAALYEGIARSTDLQNERRDADMETLGKLRIGLSQDQKDAERQQQYLEMEKAAVGNMSGTYVDYLKRLREVQIAKEIDVQLTRLQAEETRTLAELNRDSIANAKAIADAQELYAKRRAQIPDEARRAATTQYEIGELKKVADAGLKLQVDMWQSVESTARDVFRTMFDSGKSAFDKLKQALKDGLVALLYQLTIKPILIQVATTVGGAGVAQQAFGATAGQPGGAGSLMNSLSNQNLSGLIPDSVKSRAAEFFGLGSAAVNGSSGTASLAVGSAIDSGLLFGSGASSGVGTFASALDAPAALGSFGAEAVGGAVEAGSLFGSIGAEGIGSFASTGASAALGAASSYVPYIGAAIQLAQGNIKGAAFTTAGAIIGSIFPVIGTALGAVIGSIIGSLVGGGGKAPAVGTGYNFTGDFTPGGAGVTNFLGLGNYTAGEKSGADVLTSQEVHLRQFNEAIEPVFETMVALAKGLGLDASKIGTTHFDLTTPGIGQEWDDKSKPAAAAQLFAKWAEVLLPNMKKLALEGESIGQTFLRLAGEFQIVEKLMQIMGKDSTAVFGNVAEASIEMRDALIKVMGGFQQAQQAAAFFYENFYNQQEQQDANTKLLRDSLKALGVDTLPATRSDFRALVEAQDLATEPGQKMFAGLLEIAPKFAAVTQQIQGALDATKYASAADYARAVVRGGGIPGHADGGLAYGWSMVGERGPELVNFTSPGRVYTASQTRGMMGGSTAALEAAVERLTAEVAQFRADNTTGQRVLARHASTTANTLVSVTRGGESLVTTPA